MSLSSVPFIQKFIAFILSILAFFGITVGGQTNTEETTTAENTTSVTEEHTDKVTVSFDANMTTGYQWTYVFENSADGEIIASAGSEYVAKNNTGINTGSGGTQYFYFTPVKEGTVIVDFSYARPGSSGTPAKSEKVSITVYSDLSMTSTVIE